MSNGSLILATVMNMIRSVCRLFLENLKFVLVDPEVHAEFMMGHFVVQKSRRKFSLMAKDHAHEQSNKILRTKGGQLDFTRTTRHLCR